jgi:hypothetical protein
MDRVSTCFLVVPCLPEAQAGPWDKSCDDHTAAQYPLTTCQEAVHAPHMPSRQGGSGDMNA